MFKTLRNEARIVILIEVDSPLLIQSANKNVLDPSLPDIQVFRQSRYGFDTEVIPGASLKGVFRSRAEQLLRSQDYSIEDTFLKYNEERETDDGEKAYNDACPIGKTFGNLYVKSRIHISDAYPIKSVITGTRTNVGIDRITGGAKGGALFDSEVIEEGTFQTTITLQNFELWQLALILYLIKDLDEGFIRLGSSTSRGLGKVKVFIEQIQIHNYQKLSNTESNENGELRGILLGYHDNDQAKDDKKEAIIIEKWSESLFGITLEENDLEKWIGTSGYLKNIKWPKK